jgi:hypothetical protein
VLSGEVKQVIKIFYPHTLKYKVLLLSFEIQSAFDKDLSGGPAIAANHKNASYQSLPKQLFINYCAVL